MYELRQMSKDMDCSDKFSIKDQLKSAELECSRQTPSASREKAADIGLE